MRQNRITRTGLGLLIICFAVQGHSLFAQEHQTKASRQSVNPLWEEFSAEESHGYMKTFVLNDAR